jgi:hypothetical protein
MSDTEHVVLIQCAGDIADGIAKNHVRAFDG